MGRGCCLPSHATQHLLRHSCGKAVGKARQVRSSRVGESTILPASQSTAPVTCQDCLPQKTAATKVEREAMDRDAAGKKDKPEKTVHGASWTKLFGRSQIPQGLLLNPPHIAPPRHTPPKHKRGDLFWQQTSITPHCSPQVFVTTSIIQPSATYGSTRMERPYSKAPTNGTWT